MPATRVGVDKTVSEAHPGDYDGLLLPGGFINPDLLCQSAKAREFVRGFAESGKPIVTFCHGPWVLARARSGLPPPWPNAPKPPGAPKTPTWAPSSSGSADDAAIPRRARPSSNSILVAAYHVLDRHVPYQDLGADWFVRRRPEAHVRRLAHQIEALPQGR